MNRPMPNSQSYGRANSLLRSYLFGPRQPPTAQNPSTIHNPNKPLIYDPNQELNPEENNLAPDTSFDSDYSIYSNASPNDIYY